MIEALGQWVDIDRAEINTPPGGGIELKIQNADLKPEVPRKPICTRHCRRRYFRPYNDKL
jgi:hypothetical protein